MDLELEDEILNRSVKPVKWKVLRKLSVWEQQGFREDIRNSLKVQADWCGF